MPGVSPNVRRYRTLMSYWEDCDATSAGSAMIFSNPDITYLGRPAGTATANNARRIRETAVS